ncbi:unnamed protein product [Periconia digitata]|uniref:ATP-dependent DNA helicase n=1 Tax=Periconia digitata TaxID=1303443 RepID=A0A9W4XVH9_9PLEO|nr:unnamed protein product [Periconia digitata]
MTSNPRHVVQTSTEAKIAYKRAGHGISYYKQRSLERGAQLDERATRFKEKEERRKFLQKKREEREAKERQARERNGVGLATQMIGYSHTQAQLKKGMEAFLGYSKRKTDEDRKAQEHKDAEMRRSIEALTEDMSKEPWDDQGDSALPDLDSTHGNRGDTWLDDDLDDDALIEAHDMALSDPVDPVPSFSTPATKVFAPQHPVQPARAQAPKKEEPGFIRLHGPIDKMIESALTKLPASLVEFLSEDTPTNQILWDPAVSLLHKLNPLGLPPHRLRIKVGCVAMLLRDLNSSGQSSKSQHLRVLRIDKDRLECLVLDGQLEGAKMFLTRTAFPACHHNNKLFPFQRLQFPIKVSTDYDSKKVINTTLPCSSKLPLVTKDISQASINMIKKPPLEAAATKSHTTSARNPGFRLPGIPASKVKPSVHMLSSEFDGWADFLDSSTQIARELDGDQTSRARPVDASTIPTTLDSCRHSSKDTAPLSPQDFDFSPSDLMAESSQNLLEAKQFSNKQPSKCKCIRSGFEKASKIVTEQSHHVL